MTMQQVQRRSMMATSILQRFSTIGWMLLLATTSILLSTTVAITITEVDLINHKIEVVNMGGSAVDMTTWWLCNRVNGSPFYNTVPTLATIDVANSDVGAGFNLSPGLLLTMDVPDTFLPNANGELGLYNTNSFGSSSAMEDYLLYGASGIRDVTAEQAGIWIDNDSIDVSGLNAGDTIQLIAGQPGHQASDYVIAASTIGSPPAATTLSPITASPMAATTQSPITASPMTRSPLTVSPMTNTAAPITVSPVTSPAPITPSPITPTQPGGSGGTDCTGPLSFLNICGGVCFSPYATVQVADDPREFVQMKDLQIGDFVLTGDGTYAQVYSFQHYQPSAPTTYLQIQTDTTMSDENNKPIEISSEHLLYVWNIDTQRSRLVPAGTVKVGDWLVGGQGGIPSSVLSIRQVQRTGAYSPLTTKGNLVVNGIVASNYVTRSWIDHDLISGVMLHQFQHGAALPYRWYCTVFLMNGCTNERYHDQTGFSGYVMYFYHIEQWMLHFNSTMARVVFFLILSLPALGIMLLGHLVTATSGTTTVVVMVHVAVFLVGLYLIKTKDRTIMDAKFNNQKDVMKKKI